MTDQFIFYELIIFFHPSIPNRPPVHRHSPQSVLKYSQGAFFSHSGGKHNTRNKAKSMPKKKERKEKKIDNIHK